MKFYYNRSWHLIYCPYPTGDYYVKLNDFMEAQEWGINVGELTNDPSLEVYDDFGELWDSIS